MTKSHLLRCETCLERLLTCALRCINSRKHMHLPTIVKQITGHRISVVVCKYVNLILLNCFMYAYILYSPAFDYRTCFGRTYTKIGTIQRRLAWPLRKDDTQIREAFHIFSTLLLFQNRCSLCKPRLFWGEDSVA